MGNLYAIQVGEKEIKAKVIDMKGKHVIAPFYLACSHYYNREDTKHGCDKGELPEFDGRECCDCSFYDGSSVLALDWKDNEEINFMLFPFKEQYSLNGIKHTLEQIMKTKSVCVKDIFGKITHQKYEIKNPILNEKWKNQ